MPPASMSRFYLSSRDRFCHCERCLSSRAQSVIACAVCHREGRSDLAFSELTQKAKARLPRCARLCLSSRGTKRSRVSNASKQQKARLLSRLVFACHREERGDLGFRGGQTAKREIAALRSSLLVIARNVAISGFGAGKQLKARLPRCACLCLSSRGAKRSRGSGLTDS